MTEYKTINAKEGTYQTLDEDKPEGVTWDHYLKELYRSSKAYERGGEE